MISHTTGPWPSADDETTAARCIEELVRGGLTVACAESLTGGLLAALLTQIPGASAAFRGGIVCYATDTKATLVGVDEALLARVGPVDPEVARQLAAGVRRRFTADIGIGLTGVAGPAEQDGHRVGTVYVAVDSSQLRDVVSLSPPAQMPSRAEVRHAALAAALGLLGRAATAHSLA